MTLNHQKSSLLSTLWNRLKHALSSSHQDYSSLQRSRSQQTPSRAIDKRRIPYRVLYLERCLTKDTLVETVRKQLDRNWDNTYNL